MLVERIRIWKPDLVLTFDPGGGYNGHSDHRAADKIATEVVRAASEGECESGLGEPHHTQHLAYVVAPAPAFLALGGEEVRAVVGSQPEPNVEITVAPRLNPHVGDSREPAARSGLPAAGKTPVRLLGQRADVVLGELSAVE